MKGLHAHRLCTRVYSQTGRVTGYPARRPALLLRHRVGLEVVALRPQE